MTIRGSDRSAESAAPKLDEVEQIKRLIEIQKQIVALAKQNELTAKECDALRLELSQSMHHGPKRRRGADSIRELLQRFKNFCDLTCSR